MSLMRNPRFTFLLNWVFKPLNPRSFATQRTQNEIRKLTQVAMFDYFHHNRGLDFLVAESMSKNAPVFNDNLLKKLNVAVTAKDDLVRSITRFLWFHPVNEFEPFLESLGLVPSEFGHLVPCDKMFLNEDAFLLENYYVFWNYGVCREKLGKVFKEAREVFGYESGVLAKKIQAYEDLGFSKLFLLRLIVCNPRILIGDVNFDVVNVVDLLRSLGFSSDWVVENLREEGSYDWSSMYRCVSFLGDLFCDENELCELIRKRPGLIFEDSGKWTFILAGFEAKLGFSRGELSWLFRNLPQIQVEKCVSNLRRCLLFLREIEMDSGEIGKVFRSHSWWIGSCRLKKTSSLLVYMKTWKRRLHQIVLENPEEMKKWTLGSKIHPLPDLESEKKKTQFLLDLGYKENSKEMEIAFKSFRGRGCELRGRFDFLVRLGLDEKDVKDMVRACPGILAQSSGVLETKFNYLANELSYPLSTLMAFPSCFKYTLERMKLRFAMFSWLVARGKAGPKLAVSTILFYSNKEFAKIFVNRHPDGPKHWEDLMRTRYGLQPTEYSHLVPSDKMLLSDDSLSLENHHVLCSFGTDPKKIGKILKEAREVFRYEPGVLAAKIKAYEDLGFSRLALSKLIICSPSILIGNMNVELGKVVEILNLDWVMKNLSEGESYEWRSVHRVISFLRDLCDDENEVCELIKKWPGLIFEDSGDWTLILAGFETKLGSSRRELCSLFRNFPQIQVEKCVSNLRHCFLFLKEIEMEDNEIRKIFRSHSWWLGSCRLKKSRSLQNNLNTGKTRLRQVVQENPEEMKKWTLGSKIEPLPPGKVLDTKWKTMKTQFLLDLGYKENTKEMEMAFKRFRGKGSKLRERFDFLLSLGFNEKDVNNMVNVCPGILTGSSDVVETKVKYLVNELGYPLSTLVAFPECLRYTLERIKLRFAMLSWLVARGETNSKPSINTIVVYSDEKFRTRFVNLHPDGPKHFEDLKKLHQNIGFDYNNVNEPRFLLSSKCQDS